MGEDHSIFGYLQRRTTEQLRGILAEYTTNPAYKDDAYIVEMIWDILKQRDDGLEK